MISRSFQRLSVASNSFVRRPKRPKIAPYWHHEQAGETVLSSPRAYYNDQSSTGYREYSQKHGPPKPNIHWLPNIKARLGKCIMFGLDVEQAQKAARIAKILGEEWKGLVAAQQGYILEKGLLERVRWGEMVSLSFGAPTEQLCGGQNTTRQNHFGRD